MASVIGFLTLREALARLLHRWHGPLIDTMRQQFEEDGIYFLLVMRVLPILPFTLISFLAVLVEMRLVPYLLASAIGVVPPTFAFVWLGTGLTDMLTHYGNVNPLELVGTRVLPPLFGLAILSLLPVAWRRWTRRHRAGAE
jgi:uncharacterized membrane protein YdjX (TVP38/TMEM64 family)